jgi:hypothetical protein
VIARADVEREVIIVVCAVSAGVHAALTPDHLAEGTGAGVGFAASAVALGVLVVALTRRPGAAVVAGAAALLAGLLASYALAVTTGLPLVHPEPEPVDGLALFTKAVELAGLLAAADLLRRRRATTHFDPRTRGIPA